MKTVSLKYTITLLLISAVPNLVYCMQYNVEMQDYVKPVRPFCSSMSSTYLSSPSPTSHCQLTSSQLIECSPKSDNKKSLNDANLEEAAYDIQGSNGGFRSSRMDIPVAFSSLTVNIPDVENNDLINEDDDLPSIICDAQDVTLINKYKEIIENAKLWVEQFLRNREDSSYFLSQMPDYFNIPELDHSQLNSYVLQMLEVDNLSQTIPEERKSSAIDYLQEQINRYDMLHDNVQIDVQPEAVDTVNDESPQLQPNAQLDVVHHQPVINNVPQLQHEHNSRDFCRSTSIITLVAAGIIVLCVTTMDHNF